MLFHLFWVKHIFCFIAVLIDPNILRTKSLTMNNTTDIVFEGLEDLNNRYAKAFIPFVVVLAVLSFVGILGNILVLLVFCFSQQYKYTNFKIFVICLALLDLLSCITIMPAEMAKSQHYFSFPDAMPCKVKCFFNVFFNTAAAMALLTICIDRFRKVCQPLKKQIYPGLALKIVISAMAFSFLVSLPAPIMCGISTANKTNIYGTHTTVMLCTAEKRFEKSIFRSIYKVGLTCILFGVSITLIVMYVLIGRIVIRHWRVRETMGSFSIESNKSPDPSEKVEGERPTEDVFVDEDDALTEPNSPVNDPESVKYVPKKERKVLRKSSSISISSNSTQTKFNVSLRKGSLSPFQARARRRKSSVSATGVPYKTLIWLILTFIFIVTYFLYAILSFFTTKQYLMSPKKLLIYTFLFRIYFVNNIINPVIYAWLDQRFRSSCRELYHKAKSKLACSTKN